MFRLDVYSVLNQHFHSEMSQYEQSSLTTLLLTSLWKTPSLDHAVIHIKSTTLSGLSTNLLLIGAEHASTETVIRFSYDVMCDCCQRS